MTFKFLTAAATAAALIVPFGAQAQGVSGSVTGTSPDPVYTQVVTATTGTVYYCRPDLVQREGVSVRICRRVGGNTGLDGNIGAGAAAAGALIAIAVAASSDT